MSKKAAQIEVLRYIERDLLTQAGGYDPFKKHPYLRLMTQGYLEAIKHSLVVVRTSIARLERGEDCRSTSTLENV